MRKRKLIASKEAFKKNKPETKDQVTIEEDEGDDEVGNTETVDLTNLKELPHQVCASKFIFLYLLIYL